jgi:hypothetical protein
MQHSTQQRYPRSCTRLLLQRERTRTYELESNATSLDVANRNVEEDTSAFYDSLAHACDCHPRRLTSLRHGRSIAVVVCGEEYSG